MNNAEIYKESIGKLLKETDDIVFEIRSLRRDNQKATAENDNKIAHLQERLLETEATMEETLTRSGEEAIKPKCGWVHYRVMPDNFVFGNELIDEIEIEYPKLTDDYIKITKSLKLIPLKRDLASGAISLKLYTIEPQPKKFEYKYTGE
jgi:hypothetical protein